MEYRKSLEGRRREVQHLRRKREGVRHREKRLREGEQIQLGKQREKLSIDSLERENVNKVDRLQVREYVRIGEQDRRFPCRASLGTRRKKVEDSK